MGRNPLLLYMVHAVLGVLIVSLIGEQASATAAWCSSIGVLGVCWLGAWLLDRKKIYVRL